MRYEDHVRKVCGDEWKVYPDERDGGYGVAMLQAFIKASVKPTLNEMSNHLGVPIDDIAGAFYRLKRAGAFENWNLRKDKLYLDSVVTEPESARAWAHLAAISSGFLGNF